MRGERKRRRERERERILTYAVSLSLPRVYLNINGVDTWCVIKLAVVWSTKGVWKDYSTAYVHGGVVGRCAPNWSVESY
jgi:hypothetical protein